MAYYRITGDVGFGLKNMPIKGMFCLYNTCWCPGSRELRFAEQDLINTENRNTSDLFRCKTPLSTALKHPSAAAAGTRTFCLCAADRSFLLPNITREAWLCFYKCAKKTGVPFHPPLVSESQCPARPPGISKKEHDRGMIEFSFYEFCFHHPHSSR